MGRGKKLKSATHLPSSPAGAVYTNHPCSGASFIQKSHVLSFPLCSPDPEKNAQAEVGPAKWPLKEWATQSWTARASIQAAVARQLPLHSTFSAFIPFTGQAKGLFASVLGILLAQKWEPLCQAAWFGIWYQKSPLVAPLLYLPRNALLPCLGNTTPVTSTFSTWWLVLLPPGSAGLALAVRGRTPCSGGTLQRLPDRCTPSKW